MKRNVVLKLTGVERHYGQGDTLLSILKGADFSISKGRLSLSSPLPAPASRHCCISPACWSIRTAVKSTSTAMPATA